MRTDSVMQVVEVDTAKAEKSPKVAPRFDLQPPPFAELMDGPDYGNCQVGVEIHRNQRIKGKLCRFDADAEVLEVLEASKTVPTELEFANIKFIRFEKPYQINVEQKTGEDSAQALPVDNEARDFQVFFKDRLEITGKTYGSRIDKNGIHFYEQQKKGRKWRYCTHLFVSKSAVENYIIGEQIGGMLVRNKAISQDDLDEVLKTQQEQRSKLLGEYLLGNHIVEGEDLEKVLVRQQSMPNVKLGEILLSEELITENQLQEALRHQKRQRKSSLGEILVERELIDRDQIYHCLSKKLGIPFINLRSFNIRPEAINQVSAEIAFTNKAVPLYTYDNKLVVAMEDPMDWQVTDALRNCSNRQIEPVMASRDDISWALNFHYSSEDLIRGLSTTTDSGEPEQDFDTSLFSAFEIAEVTSQSVSRIINRIIEDAYRNRVSEIHFEPQDDSGTVAVRFRKDGTLSVYFRFPLKFAAAFNTRLKTMAQLNVTEKNRSQSGKIDFRKVAPIDLDLSIATIPTSEGNEDVVLHLLGKSRCMPVNALGFASGELDRLLDTVSQKQGLFILTGPVGSGKASTMHSLLNYLNHPERKIVSVEDPISIRQQGIRQIETSRKGGMNFTDALQAALRADPDILMVGEIRDVETARAAVDAALNGRLVIAGLAVDSAVDGLQRLLDLGISHLDVADAVLGIASRRLVKSLCISCKKPYQADTRELVFLASEFCEDIAGKTMTAESMKEAVNRVIKAWEQRLQVKSHFKLYKATGCKDCLDTGYRGLTGVHQLLLMTPELRRLVVNKVSRQQIQEKSVMLAVKSLKQDGIEKTLQGYTDFAQVRTLHS